ncbi:MAG: GNAT family N-acetyltransferase [Tyzzerella sp.]|uniref:GNAT family N-acetyltransferase n=1 Tax=Candidatus Fimicola merdigallinarum TaxID=2840819 RepID=A0A9D9E173_9FIRM|nr:GNAT family N-acetyltransferase [Candidatus Fimicola merdigallinarum]
MDLIVKKFDELTSVEVYEILKSRSEIFTVEQKICCQDMDDMDYDSLHCFFKEGNRVIAYLRSFYCDDTKDVVKIGRVLTLNHGKNIGRKLMEQSLQAIKREMPCKKIVVNAQKYAVGFYEKFGFVTTSDDFLEEGIVHVSMELQV